MASVKNVKLTIGKGSSESRREVTVTYDLCFNSCEAMDNTVFVEKVTLRGDDPIWDDHLVTLRNGCVRAQSGCIERSITKQVSKSALDEDPDTVILGWVVGDKDEVYARVTLTPFKPSGGSSDSNVIKRHFGKAGG